MKILGQHLIVELSGCNAACLSDVSKVESIMIAVAKAVNATIVSTLFHYFKPQGVSDVVVIAESRLAVHTWPEQRCVSMDLFAISSYIL
jgi:S-adenosylmethionine decarboxylase